MLKRLSAVVASSVVFVFIAVSVAHACSGLASMKSELQQSSMNMGASDDGAPCGKEKPDICKSVRDSMLSVKPSVSGSEQTIVLPELLVERPFAVVFTPMTRVTEASFHPVFKVPLSLSYSVLRI